MMSGCQRGPLPPDVPAIDPNLPIVENIKTIPDMTDVGFEWTPQYDEGVEGYYLYRGTGEGALTRIATINDRYTSHYVDSGLIPETLYHYRMSTFTASKQESTPSAVVSAQTRPLLDSVPFVQAIVGLPSRVKLLWRPHPYERVESYIVERNELNSASWSRVAQVRGRLNAEYIDTGLKDNHMYRYRVMVRTFDGIISKPSDIIEAKTKPLPKMIEGIQATRTLPKKIVITWSPSSEPDISHYRVYRAPTSVLFYTFLAKTNEPKFEDLINTNGADRYYKVTAVDVDGLESLRQPNPIMGTTLDVPLPPAITGVRQDASGVLLTWSQVDQRAEKFEVIKKARGDTQVIQGITSGQFLDHDIVKGVSYTYEVVAIDPYGLASKASQSVRVQIPNE
ncbi:MAG: fibronectin type III domain-containing protein [Campylobacterales bacterium]|nr:fibronectin type III domain-containing protein [Campylobacterales bacterium]